MYKWFTACCLFAGLLVIGNLQGWGMITGVFKQLASTCFILTAWSAGARESRYGKLILVGLCFSWWGDAFLIKGGDTYFLLGLVSFLIAHVLYCCAFFAYDISVKWTLTSHIAIVPLVALTMASIFPHVSDDMKIPVIAYTVVITTMVMFSVGTQGVRPNVFIVIGAIMFYFSDIAVARGQFMDTPFPEYVWGLPLYFLGQLLLAVSIRSANQSTLAPGVDEAQAGN